MSKPSLLQIDSADVQKQVEDFIKSAAELLQQTEELLRPRSGHSVTRLAQRNRLLVQRAKILRLQSVDPLTQKKVTRLFSSPSSPCLISCRSMRRSLSSKPLGMLTLRSHHLKPR